jgi:hypothetical protein
VSTPTGPYETETEAHVAAQNGPADLYAALFTACGSAGVELGAFDLRILAWLARWEPAAVQVVVGLIARAYGAGFREGGGSDA